MITVKKKKKKKMQFSTNNLQILPDKKSLITLLDHKSNRHEEERLIIVHSKLWNFVLHLKIKIRDSAATIMAMILGKVSNIFLSV